jgi:CBS domain-containing protein
MSALAHLHRAAIARADLAAPPPIPSSRQAASTVARAMNRVPPTLHRSASLWTAWELLHRTASRHLVVVDDHERPLGVLDDRTIALEWPAGPMATHRLSVQSVLGDRARPRVHADDDLGDVARVLLGARTDAAPVVDRNGRLIGLITLRHFAELAAAGHEEEK